MVINQNLSKADIELLRNCIERMKPKHGSRLRELAWILQNCVDGRLRVHVDRESINGATNA